MIYPAPVVQNVDSAIQWINLYPVDIAIGFPNTYPLDSDIRWIVLSSFWTTGAWWIALSIYWTTGASKNIMTPCDLWQSSIFFPAREAQRLLNKYTMSFQENLLLNSSWMLCCTLLWPFQYRCCRSTLFFGYFSFNLVYFFKPSLFL